jgi:hypothetical protein
MIREDVTFGELGIIGEGAVVTYIIMALGEIEENHENICQDCQCLGRHLNRASPEFKSETLSSEPTCSERYDRIKWV